MSKSLEKWYITVYNKLNFLFIIKFYSTEIIKELVMKLIKIFDADEYIFYDCFC